MNITITTTAKTDEEAKALLAFSFPFRGSKTSEEATSEEAAPVEELQ